LFVLNLATGSRWGKEISRDDRRRTHRRCPRL